MTQRPAHLLEFTKPPLTEVAIGIQFAALAGIRVVHLGFIWQQFRENFPHVAEHAPLNPAFETFGTMPMEQARFELLASPPLPRLWFLDDRGVELIQFQADRFLHNWRKVVTDTIYPRYEGIRDRFLEELDQLSDFLKRENLGAIEPNQCELTYVNQLVSEPGEDLAADLGRVFRVWTKDEAAALPMPYEDARFLMRFVLRPDGDPTGRILVSVEPGRRADGTSVLQFTLTGRGRPAEPSKAGIRQFLDHAREGIAQTFVAITTDEMQQWWGRTQ